MLVVVLWSCDGNGRRRAARAIRWRVSAPLYRLQEGSRLFPAIAELHDACGRSDERSPALNPTLEPGLRNLVVVQKIHLMYEKCFVWSLRTGQKCLSRPRIVIDEFQLSSTFFLCCRPLQTDLRVITSVEF